MSTKSKKLRFFSLMWDYASALSLIALLFLLWHLGKGPVRVDFLKPYIVQALTNETSAYDLNVGSVNLELVNSVQPVNIIAKNVVFKGKNEAFLVEAPRLKLAFSARALLKGLIAPSLIAVEAPKITLTTTYGIKTKAQSIKAAQSQEPAQSKEEEALQGTEAILSGEEEDLRALNLKKLEFYFEQFEDFMERFNSPERLYIESFINSIKITDATLKINEAETGRQFLFSDMDWTFERGIADIVIKSDSAVKFENRTAGVDMALKYKLYNDEVQYLLNFSDLVVTDLYDILVVDKGDIRAVDIPVDGQLSAVIDFGSVLKDKEHFADNLGQNIKSVAFAIEGGEGKIGFGESKDFDYDVSSFKLAGQLTGGLDKIEIENAAFNFNGKTAMLGLSAEGFKDYILKGNLENFKLLFKADVGSFEMDELSLLWPKYLGVKAWEWCKESLFGGAISNGAFLFDFGWNKNSKSFGLLELKGTADVADANLSYLEGMPVIKNVYGTASFSQDRIEIKVDKGVSDGVILTGGTVVLYDLDKEDNFISIKLAGNSTITSALELIDHEPLGFTKEMGVDAKLVSGDVDINLGLDFELKSNLAPEEIKVSVEGDLSEVEYLGMPEGKTLTADKLKLNVTEKGFELKGEAKYQGVMFDLALKEEFAEKDYKSKIVADIKLDDATLKKLGIDNEMLAAPYFTGSSQVTAVLTFLNSGEIELEVDGSLKDTAIDYAFLGFAKEKGMPCRAKAKILIANDKLKEVSSFSLLKSQFSASGKMSADAQGRLKSIDITEIKAPKTFAKAKVDLGYEPALKLKVTVTGDAYDLTDFFDKKKKDTALEQKKKKKSLKDPLEEVMDTNIVIGVNKLWTNDNVPVTNFAGKAELKHGIGLYKMNMVGNYGMSRDVRMKLDFEPRGEEYVLRIDSNNAGSTLKVLRLYDNMKGGNLKIEAKRDKYKNLKGYAKIRDFSLTNAPVFAKVLSLASLTGIVDMLSGSGLGFSHFDAPFSYTFSTKNLAAEEAKMYGSVLGVSMSGEYNLVDGTLSAEGMVIPAYGLNTLIGNIPLVGKVLAGRDGTVFATNYSVSGTAEKPVVSINPLSTLAPNSIKELFSSKE